MSRYLVVLFAVAVLAAPSAGFADEVPTSDVLVTEAVTAAPGPIPEVVPVETPTEPEPEIVTETAIVPVDDMSATIQTIGGLMAVIGAVTPIMIEFVKVSFPEAAPWLIRLIAIVVGALGGLFVGLGWFGPVPYSIGAAVLAGAAGGGGFTLFKWGSQVARQGRGGVGGMTLAVCMIIFMIGCGGTVFTVKPGDPVSWSVKPTLPAHAVVRVKTDEVCRVNVPDGTIAISNDCPAGQVSTMDTTGKVPTCVSNPCPPGTSFTFLSTGLAACQ